MKFKQVLFTICLSFVLGAGVLVGVTNSKVNKAHALTAGYCLAGSMDDGAWGYDSDYVFTETSSGSGIYTLDVNIPASKQFKVIKFDSSGNTTFWFNTTVGTNSRSSIGQENNYNPGSNMSATSAINAKLAIHDISDNSTYGSCTLDIITTWNCTLTFNYSIGIPDNVELYIPGSFPYKNWDTSTKMTINEARTSATYVAKLTSLSLTYQYKVVPAVDGASFNWGNSMSNDNLSFTVTNAQNSATLNLSSYIPSATLESYNGSSWATAANMSYNFQTTNKELVLKNYDLVENQLIRFSYNSNTYKFDKVDQSSPSAACSSKQYIINNGSGDIKVTYSGKYDIYLKTTGNTPLWIQAASEVDALDFATKFLAAMRADNVCGSTQAAWSQNNLTKEGSALASTWATWKAKFENNEIMTSGARWSFSQESSNATIVEARELYVHVLTRYPSLAEWSNGPSHVNVSPIISSNIKNTTDTTVIIIVVSSISLIALGGFLLLKKKKEN